MKAEAERETATSSPPSLPQPHPTCPPFRIQVQFRVLDPHKAALALVDDLVEHPNTCVQIRMPDAVGVPGVELVDLRHLAGGFVD